MTSATNATTPTTSIDPRKGSYESLPNPNSLYNLASNPNFTNQARPTGSLLEKLRALRENPETQEIPILPSSPILTEFTEQSRNTVNEQFIPAEMGQGGINIDSFENLEIQSKPPDIMEKQTIPNIAPKSEEIKAVVEKPDLAPAEVEKSEEKRLIAQIPFPKIAHSLFKNLQEKFFPDSSEAIKEVFKGIKNRDPHHLEQQLNMHFPK